MPRKKKELQDPESTVYDSNSSGVSLLKQFRDGESYISLLLGIIVVVIVGILLITFIRSAGKEPTKDTSSAATVADPTFVPLSEDAATIFPTGTITVVEEPTITPSTIMDVEKKQGEQNSPSVRQEDYVVKTGDSLWSIAQNKYENGYNWVDIARANNLQNPNVIAVGSKITLPKIETKTLSTSTGPQMSQAPPANVSNAITGNTYTVLKGDDIWDIAVRAYGDGYKWVQIARANNLANPNLIHSGNILQIPR